MPCDSQEQGVKLLEISIHVDGEAAEAVSGVFNQHGLGGTVIEELPPEGPSSPPQIVAKTFLRAEDSACLAKIEGALWHLSQIYPMPPPTTRWLSEADWRANSRNKELADIPVSPAALIEIIGLVESGQISNLAAKSVLTEMIDSGKTAAAIVKEKNLVQISDESSLQKDLEAVIRENPKVVADFRSGKENSVMFLVGQVMKRTQGKANPKLVQDMLKRRLADA